MAANYAVEFQDVTKDYPLGLLGVRKRRAVSGVSFAVEPGQVFGILGPNRAGKTTLIKILLTLCQLTSGKALRLGRPVTDRSTLGRVGYVHENHAFPRYLTPASLLEYYGALSLVPYEELRKRISVLLDRVGLADRADDAIRTFSKGMLQRLGIAQALVNDPELLVLDEPNEGLDLHGRQLMTQIIRERRQRGYTVVLVSHVLPEVEQLCDRVAVIVGGQLAHAGTVASLTHPADGGAPRSLEQALQSLYGKPAA